MVGRLPTATLGGKEYFIDSRLGELRNVDNPHDVKTLTCANCDDRKVCAYVYDLYNTDGECLAMK